VVWGEKELGLRYKFPTTRRRLKGKGESAGPSDAHNVNDVFVKKGLYRLRRRRSEGNRQQNRDKKRVKAESMSRAVWHVYLYLVPREPSGSTAPNSRKEGSREDAGCG